MEIQEIANIATTVCLVGSIIIMIKRVDNLEKSTSYTLFAQAKKLSTLEKEMKEAVENVVQIANNLRQFVIADKKMLEADVESTKKILSKIQDINLNRQHYVDSQLESMESEIHQIHNLLGLNPMQVEFINQYPMEERRES